MGKPIVLVEGDTFNRLVCTGESLMREGRRWYLFKCACGNDKLSQARDVCSGKVGSCGCYRSDKTSERSNLYRSINKASGEYSSWSGMIQRCTNKSNPKYKNYGGRGIFVCERWRSFDAFLEDVGEKPSKSHSIGRIDNDDGYHKGNCRWETPSQQANNTTRSRFIVIDGVRMTVSEAAKINGVKPDTIYQRLNSGMSECDSIKKTNYSRVFVVLNNESVSITKAIKDLEIPLSTYYKRVKQGYSPQELINHYCGVKAIKFRDGRFKGS